MTEQARSQEGRTIRSFDGRPSTPTPLPAETPFAVEGNRPCEHPFTRLYRRDGRIICDACGHDEPRLAEQPRSQEAALLEALVSGIAYAMARSDLPARTETGREYAARLAPLVIESGYLRAALAATPPGD